MSDMPQPGQFPPPPPPSGMNNGGYPNQPYPNQHPSSSQQYPYQQHPGYSYPAHQPYGVESKRLTAGVLALLTGSLGVHKFYLGYTKQGVLQILLTVFTCGLGSLVPFVEGILYLTKSEPEFIQTYQIGRKGWF